MNTRLGTSHLKSICLLAIALRVLFVLLTADFGTENYWEYGEIGKNVLSEKGYSIFYFQNDELNYRFTPESTPFPSAYMPPGYVAFLMPFLTIDNVIVRNILLFLAHILISTATIIGLYCYVQRVFTERIAIISCCLFAIMPDFVYAVKSFTPTILFHGGIIFLLLLLQINRRSLLFFMTVGGILSFLIYLRSECIIFLVLLTGQFIYQRQWKKIGVIGGTVILMLAPWSIRNYYTFHSFVPFTTSAGLNLYRGNNIDEIGAWGNATTKQREKLLPRNEQFEIAYNDMFFEDAANDIVRNPVHAVLNIPVKLFDLWVFNRHSEQTNSVYNAYSLLLTFLFFFGCIISVSSKNLHLYLFFIYFSIVVAIFFCLPRYQTMIRIGMIPFVAIGIETIITAFLKNFNTGD